MEDNNDLFYQFYKNLRAFIKENDIKATSKYNSGITTISNIFTVSFSSIGNSESIIIQRGFFKSKDDRIERNDFLKIIKNDKYTIFSYDIGSYRKEYEHDNAMIGSLDEIEIYVYNQLYTIYQLTDITNRLFLFSTNNDNQHKTKTVYDEIRMKLRDLKIKTLTNE